MALAGNCLYVLLFSLKFNLNSELGNIESTLKSGNDWRQFFPRVCQFHHFIYSAISNVRSEQDPGLEIRRLVAFTPGKY